MLSRLCLLLHDVNLAFVYRVVVDNFHFNPSMVTDRRMFKLSSYTEVTLAH